MLLRIYYVKDFPLHTLLLEIRKGYFMEPENKFATAEEKEEEEEEEEKKEIELCSIKSSANNDGEISRGLGDSLKNDCIPLFSSSLFFSLFCSTAMFQIHAWSFFRKCVVLMHFKSPFSKHNRISP